MDKETLGEGNEILMDCENRTLYFVQNGIEITHKTYDGPIRVLDYAGFKNSILTNLNSFGYGCLGIGTGKGTVHVR